MCRRHERVFEQSGRVSLIGLNGRVAGQYPGLVEVGDHEFIVTPVFLLM